MFTGCQGGLCKVCMYTFWVRNFEVNLVKLPLVPFKKYVGKRTKTNRGRGVLACVYVRFKKKNAEIFKMKFFICSPVFPTDYNGSMKY